MQTRCDAMYSVYFTILQLGYSNAHTDADMGIQRLGRYLTEGW